MKETHKILEDPGIKIATTCVRVPVLRAHSESINITLKFVPVLTALFHVVMKLTLFGH